MRRGPSLTVITYGWSICVCMYGLIAKTHFYCTANIKHRDDIVQHMHGSSKEQEQTFKNVQVDRVSGRLISRGRLVPCVSGYILFG